jgi:hypothetical protein
MLSIFSSDLPSKCRNNSTFHDTMPYNDATFRMTEPFMTIAVRPSYHTYYSVVFPSTCPQYWQVTYTSSMQRRYPANLNTQLGTYFACFEMVLAISVISESEFFLQLENFVMGHIRLAITSFTRQIGAYDISMYIPLRKLRLANIFEPVLRIGSA